jgi:hypothetical protein
MPVMCRVLECFNCCDLTTVYWAPTPCSPTASCPALVVQNDPVWLGVPATIGWTVFVNDPEANFCTWREGVCPKPCSYAAIISSKACGTELLPDPPTPTCP